MIPIHKSLFGQMDPGRSVLSTAFRVSSPVYYSTSYCTDFDYFTSTLSHSGVQENAINDCKTSWSCTYTHYHYT